jgi:hypothetical protein
MSPWDTADGRSTGEKENTEQTKQRLEYSLDWTNQTIHFEAELNFPWGDEIEENPLTPLESSSRT